MNTFKGSEVLYSINVNDEYIRFFGKRNDCPLEDNTLKYGISICLFRLFYYNNLLATLKDVVCVILVPFRTLCFIQPSMTKSLNIKTFI